MRSSSPEGFDYLIIGGGLAAASAVDGIRERDAVGSILMLSEEDMPPYHRPPLSKEYLQTPEAGRELLHVKPEGWIEEAAVALATGERASRLDPDQREVATLTGRRLRGRRVLLATGGRPRVPRVRGIGLEGVHTLRTVADSEAIRAAAAGAGTTQETPREPGAERAVLLGAGFIGMEVAASLAHLGLRPVVVEQSDRVWPGLLPPALARFMQGYFEQRGVEFRLGTTVREFRGERRLQSAVLEDGTEVVTDLAVVGCGIRPNAELAVRAGLPTRDGIIVDEWGRTSHHAIYAAGDVARFPDPVFGDLCRVEHWDHARAHGRSVGRNMGAGAAVEPYTHLSYYFSHVFDLSLNVFGRPTAAEEVVQRGRPAEGPSVVFTAAGGRLSAAILINATGEMGACEELVRRRPSIDALRARLADSAEPLAELATG